MRSLLRPLLTFLLPPVLLAGCASIARVPIGKAAEAATMGRERTLREPMRPVRGETRVLVFALDGVGRDDLHRALREGRLPALASLLGAPSGGGDPAVYARGYSAPAVLSVLPSSTMVAWATIFTGATPAHHGVPGNEWFVREEEKFYAPVPISVRSRSHSTQLLTDELLSELLLAPTVYEQVDLRAHVSLFPVLRGADLLTVPNLATLGDLVFVMATGALQGKTGRNPEVHRETDETSIRSLAGAADDYGVPDLQVVYFPGIDLFTHQADDPIESQQRYLREVTGPAIEQVLDLYREAGVLDDTYVLFVSDHGHTPVPKDEAHALPAEGAAGPAGVLEGTGFRVRPPSLSEKRPDAQAVLAYQGSAAFVYLADRSTCLSPGERCDWSRSPRLEEDVLPAARAFFEASRDGAGVPELKGTLDLVLARPASAGPEPSPFQVFDGERLVPVSEYLRRHPRPDLLRLQERLDQLTDGPHGDRAGDLLLFARSGTGVPLEERYHFGPPVSSDHGGAHRQDSEIPLILAHPRRSGAEIRAIVRPILGEAPSQTGIAPLIRALLGR